MKDIDFDELDRAVNSLMSNVPGDKPADTTPAPASTADTSADDAADVQAESDQVETVTAPVLNFDSSIETTPETNQDTPEEADAETETFTEAMQLVEEGPASPAVPAARRGRFMDVVRPSVREASKPAPSRAVSRQGAVLQPSTLRPEEPSLEPAEAVTQSPEVTTEYTSLQEATFAAPTFQESEIMPEPAAPEAVDAEAPLSSPFLPDAKVEKRPLGRTTGAAPVVDLAAELAVDPVEDTSASSTYEDTISPHKDAQLPEQPLPAELGSELLTIETSIDNLPAEPTQSAQPVSPVTQTPEPTRVMTGTSIPQQYKVQPQTPMNEAPAVGTIYDAQPLVHTAEKKSGWLWKIVAIIAIALLGAGGGAAIYYLGLI